MARVFFYSAQVHSENNASSHEEKLHEIVCSLI